jgi:hypothetical protein
MRLEEITPNAVIRGIVPDAMVSATPEAREGFAAFLEKRHAAWVRPLSS